MNLQLFSFWGYLSVAFWLATIVLWAAHALRRPRRWLCHIAVVVAVGALVLAKINSKTYVNRIQIDRSEEIAAAQARQEAARRAAEEARAGEVARVRFAEDDADDYLDTAGMDEADLKYISSFDEDATPEWKKQKQTRSRTGEQDDSLEALIDTTAGEKKQGVDASVAEESAAEPIVMPEKQMMLANKLDGMNLKLIRWLVLVGVGFVLVDYVKRFNCPAEAYLPLPLPSRWANDLTPLPPVRSWLARQGRSTPEALLWLIRRGDSFLYLTDDKQVAAMLPERAWRFPRLGLAAVDIIHVTDDNPVAPDFILESLWYGRCSFVVDSEARADRLMQHMLEWLEERRKRRAHVRQNVHVVWEVSSPLSSDTLAGFERLGRVTGVSLVVRAQDALESA